MATSLLCYLQMIPAELRKTAETLKFGNPFSLASATGAMFSLFLK
jgi:hypothetical protein